MTVAFVTSSSKSRVRFPSLTISEQQRRDVAGVERRWTPTGIVAGRFSGATIVTPLSVTDGLAGLRQLAVAAERPTAAMSTMTEPGFIFSTAVRGDEHRRLAAGTWAVVMTTSMPADGLVELGLLGGALLGGELARVAAGAGRVDLRS